MVLVGDEAADEGNNLFHYLFCSWWFVVLCVVIANEEEAGFGGH